MVALIFNLLHPKKDILSPPDLGFERYERFFLAKFVQFFKDLEWMLRITGQFTS